MRKSACSGVLALTLWTASGLAQSTATYIGPNNGNWNAASNWNLGVVPFNGDGNTFNAIVPANTTVQFNIDGISEISGLNLQGGSQLNVTSGRQLTVTGVSVTAGVINATGAGSRFQANSPFASMQLNSRALANNGAVIWLGGNSYSFSGNFSGDILSAVGTDSRLNMSGFSSISTPYANCCGYREPMVRAAAGGIVDLSSLATIVGVSSNGNLRIREETGGRILLPNLVNSSGYVIFEPLSPIFSLPSLQNASTATILVAAGNTFRTDALTSCTSSSISIANGGTFVAPNLKIFDGSSIELNSLRTFIAPPFTSINGSSIRLSDGIRLAIAATDYNSAVRVSDMLLATGSGTVLDVSSLITLRAPYNNCCGYFENKIRAMAGAVIDLSNLKTIQGFSSNGWLRIRAENAGTVRLNSLATSTGAVLYEASGSNMTLPLLKSATSAGFAADVFDTISVPSLEEVHGCAFYLSDGATMIAPLLQIFDNSQIEITPSRFFTAPQFIQINNSRISAKEGAYFSVKATQYVNTGTSGDIFVADGFESELDLSSIKTFSNPYNNCCGYRESSVRASNSGKIDLSGLDMVAGALSNGVTRFDAVSGGTLVFGNTVFSSGLARVAADGIYSHLYFRNASFRAKSQFVLSLVANAHVAASLDFDSKDEHAIQLGDGKLAMDGDATGDAPQKLEVACPDLGMPSGALTPNFQIGQLTVGRAAQPTVVQLVDAIDNGNRPAGQQERLYLQGFPAENGLRLLGGSTLYLGDIELYAVIANQWERVRGMFGPGQTCISFDGGQICLGEPLPCPSDLNGDQLVDDADFQHFVVAYNILDCADPSMPPGCRADLNGDGMVEDADFQIFVVAYNALLCP